MRKFIVVLLILFFIIVAPFTVIAYNLNRTFFNLDFYRTKFADSDFYQSITDTIASGIAGSQYFNLAGSSLLETEELKEMVEVVIAPDWLEEQLDVVMTGIFDLFDLEKDPKEASIVLDLSSKKVQAEQMLQAKIDEKVANLPTCDQDDVNTFSDESFNISSACRPPDIDTSQFMEQNNFYAANLFTNIPDQFNLIEFVENGMTFEKEEESSSSLDNNFWGNIATIRNVITFLRYVYIFSLFLLPISLVLIILLSLPHLKAIFRRLGLALIFPGLFLFIIALVPNITAELFLRNINLFQAGLVAVPNESLQKLVYSFITGFYRPILWQSVIALGLALIFIIVSCIIKKKHAQTNNQS